MRSENVIGGFVCDDLCDGETEDGGDVGDIGVMDEGERPFILSFPSLSFFLRPLCSSLF